MDILQKLKHLDETTLLELLELSSEDLVDAFLDRIEEHKSRIYKFVTEELEAFE